MSFRTRSSAKSLAQDGALESQFTEGKRLALFPGPSARQGCMCIEQTGPNQRWLPSGAEESPGRGDGGGPLWNAPSIPRVLLYCWGDRTHTLRSVRDRPASSWRILPFQGDEKGSASIHFPKPWLPGIEERSCPQNSKKAEASFWPPLNRASAAFAAAWRRSKKSERLRSRSRDHAPVSRCTSLAAGTRATTPPRGRVDLSRPLRTGEVVTHSTSQTWIKANRGSGPPLRESAETYPGRGIRAQRREVLQKRLDCWKPWIPLAQPVTARQLAEAQETFQKLGLIPRPPPLHSSVRARIGAGTTPFRFFRSPAGFGGPGWEERPAERPSDLQNRRTPRTFGSTPKDSREPTWFSGWAGPQLSLRGSTVCRPDCRLVRAPEGEWVGCPDRPAKTQSGKPKGAPPGLVQVGKSSPLRVRVGADPGLQGFGLPGREEWPNRWKDRVFSRNIEKISLRIDLVSHPSSLRRIDPREVPAVKRVASSVLESCWPWFSGLLKTDPFELWDR